MVHSYNRREMALFPYAPNEVEHEMSGFQGCHVPFGSPKSYVRIFYNKIESHALSHDLCEEQTENFTIFLRLNGICFFVSSKQSALFGGTSRDIVGRTNAIIHPEWSQCDTGSVAVGDDVLQRQ